VLDGFDVLARFKLRNSVDESESHDGKLSWAACPKRESTSSLGFESQTTQGTNLPPTPTTI